MLSKEQIIKFSTADDFHVSPYYDDGITLGTPTWIWSVVVNGEIYIRPWNGKNSRWFKSAINNGGGQFGLAQKQYQARFEYVPLVGNEKLIDDIDAMYKEKYKGSMYMPPMISKEPRNATVRVSIIGENDDK